MGPNQLPTTNSQIIGANQQLVAAAKQPTSANHQATGANQQSGATHPQADEGAQTNQIDTASQQGPVQALDLLQPHTGTAAEPLQQTEQTDEATPVDEIAEHLRSVADNDIIDIVDTESSSSSVKGTHADQRSPDPGAAVDTHVSTQAEVGAAEADLAQHAEGAHQGYDIPVPSDHEIYVQDMEIHKLRTITLQQTSDAFASWKVSQRAIADDPNVGPELRELAEDVLEEIDDVLEIMSDIKDLACRQQEMVEWMLEKAKKEKPEQ